MSELKTKRHHVTREEEADRDLNGTQFSKGSAILTALFFLLFVFGVPIAQHFVEIRANLAKQAEWDPKSGLPKPGLAPKIYEVFNLFPTKQQLAEAKGFWGYWSLIPSTEKINGFDDDLKQQSILTEALLSPAQQVLTGFLGVGNEKAYCGQPGWLFYRPDVEYLTSGGFLDPKVLKARSHQAEIQPDPVKAILDFGAQLKARGIDLIVVPMPTKPMIHPEMLLGSDPSDIHLQNPSYPAFLQDLEAAGVKVYDPTELLLRRKAETGQKQYLETDTHWTPDAMAAVSKDLTSYIAKNSPLQPVEDGGYTSRKIPISNLGDIAEMLKLPKGQTIYRPQTVQTEQVQHESAPWSPDRNGDVLLLGDSFSNIYSLGGMNWGEASGFAEHLSMDLARPVDKIVINAGGSIETRRDLARQMHQSDRLAGKHLVIYEFSMRDLSQGDWKLIPLPTPPKPTPIPTPVPVAKLVEFNFDSVSPSVFDPGKGEIIRAQVTIPAGSWQASVRDDKGSLVRTVDKGTTAADSHSTLKWDGKMDDGKPALPGSYVLVLSGARLDKTKLAEATSPILVSGAEAKAAGVGAKPAKFDVAAGQTTVADFNVPAADTYQADVYGPDGKKVRTIGREKGGPGIIHVPWDGKDRRGQAVADGRYAIRLSPAHGLPWKDVVEVKVAVVTGPKAVPTIPKGNSGQTGPGVKPPTKPPTNPPVSDDMVVTGRIESRGDQPKSGAYKDAVLAVHLTDLKVVGGKIGNANILVYVWGMRDNKPVDGAYQVGQTITLRLTPWAKVEGKYGSYNRIELNGDEDFYSWPTFWGETK